MGIKCGLRTKREVPSLRGFLEGRTAKGIKRTEPQLHRVHLD